MTEPDEPALRARLERWQAAGLITSEQREAIEIYERAQTPPAARISAVVEVLVYLGAAAVLASVFGLLSDVGDGAQAVFLVVLSVTAAFAGNALRGPDNTPTARASSILWFLSVGFLFAGFVNVAEELGIPSSSGELLATSAPSLLLAVVLYRLQRRAPQLLALYGASLWVLLLLLEIADGLTPTTGGLATAALGVAGYAGARSGTLAPPRTARTLFALTLAVGLFIPTFTADGEWAEVLGIATAGAMLGLSLAWRAPELLVVGAAAMFAFVTGAVLRHFADALGVPLALLIVGALLIGAGVLVASLRPHVRET